MLTFSFEAIERIRSHVERRSGEEAGGLLAARGDVICWALDAVNCAADPRCEFGIKPSDLAQLLGSIEREGYELAGSYHSHPNGNPHMSYADAATARATGILLIIAVGRPWRWSLWDAAAGGEAEFAIAPPWSV